MHNQIPREREKWLGAPQSSPKSIIFLRLWRRTRQPHGQKKWLPHLAVRQFRETNRRLSLRRRPAILAQPLYELNPFNRHLQNREASSLIGRSVLSACPFTSR